ncbi:MAG: PfkB family carbohydrate kinase [Spirochaetota bacterium]|nr:PfkB family carbohydrate kinase [Spirochaetota bacterium]
MGGARQLTNSNDPLKMAELLQNKYNTKLVAISHGDKGCFVATPEESFQSPAFAISPIDGTGSGDAFHAGMVYGLVHNWPIHNTAEFANACGALNTIELGARTGMTSATKVDDFIQSYTKK